MKEYFIYTIAISVISAVVWGEIQNAKRHDKHGYELCLRINELENVYRWAQGYDHIDLDCDEIYGVKNEH